MQLLQAGMSFPDVELRQLTLNFAVAEPRKKK